MSNPIQWFPGHMSSALKMMSTELKLCDAVIYMLDARCPVSCLNPKFDELLIRKPTLFVINKSDLALKEAVKTFEKNPTVKEIYEKRNGGVLSVSLNSALSGSSKIVHNALNNLLKAKLKSAAEKGVNRTIRAMVIGVTNCGKSTFINNLAGKSKTLTGDKPGVTRTKQWVPATDHLWVLDTPGTLWPSFDNPQVAKNLAYVGSIKDDVLNVVELAKDLLVDIYKLDKFCIKNRFNINSETADDGEVFKEICRKRGYILKGGTLDEERAAKAILTEFRAGKLGRFNLDFLLSSK